jgi:hypothetical protein
MTIYSIARGGVWTGSTVDCSAAQIAHNVPDGCIAIEGEPAELIAAGLLQPRDPAEMLAEVTRAAKAERNRRLQACDWTQLPDVPAGTREAWAKYRQALRDVTEQPGFPTDITWPVPPA